MLGDFLSEAGFPAVGKWVERIDARPAARKAIPEDNFVDKILKASDAKEQLKRRTSWVDERRKDEL